MSLPRANLNILRLKQVESITGLKRSTIYERIASQSFPSQITLGGRTVGWLETEILSWIENQIRISRA